MDLTETNFFVQPIVDQLGKIHVYVILFVQRGEGYFVVKNLTYKDSINFRDDIIDLNIDQDAQIIAIQKQPNELFFHDFIVGRDEVKMNSKMFQISTRTAIKEFYFFKKDNLKDPFLAVLTQENFEIYQGKNFKIIEKILSIPLDEKIPLQVKFQNKESDGSGSLYLLSLQKLEIYEISGIGSRGKCFVEDTFSYVNKNYDFQEFLFVDQKIVGMLTDNDLMISYELMDQGVIKIINFKQRHHIINSNKLMHCETSNAIFGQQQNQQKIFSQLKKFLKKTYNYQEIFWDFFGENSQNCLLVNQDIVVFVNNQENKVELYSILSNGKIVAIDKFFDLPWKIEKIKSVEYSQDQEKVLDLIIIDESISVFKLNLNSLPLLSSSKKFQLVDIDDKYQQNIFIKIKENQEYQLTYQSGEKEITKVNLETHKIISQVVLPEKILEIKFNKNYPQDITVITEDLKINFLNKNLKNKAIFDLKQFKSLTQNMNNLDIKFMYDEFYILYLMDEIYIGKLDSEEGGGEFEILDLGDYYLQDLKYQVNQNSQSKDSIVYFNDNHLCLQNNNKLVFGDLKLISSNEQGLTSQLYPTNIHKYILMTHYDFSFFNRELLKFCINQNTLYFFYYLLHESVQDDKFTISFNPLFIEQNLFISKNELLEKTQLNSLGLILKNFEEKFRSFEGEKIRNFEEIEEIINILKSIQQNEQSLDWPSLSFYYEYLNNTQLTSEMIVSAMTSDQQDFIFSVIFPGQNLFNPPQWSEMKKFGLVYWYENTNNLKRMIDKSVILSYKKEKDVFKVLLWFVILGKEKVLLSLFKMAPGQDKFVKFFSQNFNDPATSSKCINNAFKLKSQKKYQLCASFFLLAKAYSEAISIILDYEKDTQLAVLIYRLLRHKISQDEQKHQEIQRHFKDSILEVALESKDRYFQSIFYFITQDNQKVVELMTEGKDESHQVDQVEIDQDLGFQLVSFSNSQQQFIKHFDQSGNWKRFLNISSTQEINHITTEFDYHYQQKQFYLALLTLIRLKLKNQESYNTTIASQNQKIWSILQRIYLKNLKTLILEKSYWRMIHKQSEVRELVVYFGLKETKLDQLINWRISLMGDLELNLFKKLIDKDYVEANEYIKELINQIIELNRKLLKMSLGRYQSYHQWNDEIWFVEQFIVMLNNLFLSSDQYYLEIHKKYKHKFAEIIHFWCFLVCLHTNCWQEALELIERVKDFDILSEEFSKFLKIIQNKIQKKFQFFSNPVLQDTLKIDLSPSDLDVMIFSLFKLLYTQSYLNINKQSQNHNLLELTLQDETSQFLKNCQDLFQKIYQKFNLDQLETLHQEIKSLMTLPVSSLSRTNFYLLRPKLSFELDVNNKISSQVLNVQNQLQNLMKMRILRILGKNDKNLNEELKGVKRNFFGEGIEIFKVKGEVNAFNVGVNSVIGRILVSPNTSFPEIYALINNKIRKVYLYESLMMKTRKEQGYHLMHYNDLSSFSMISENPLTMTEEQISKKDFILQVLYGEFFSFPRKVHNKHAFEVIEKLIEIKTQKQHNFDQIGQIQIHHFLPIIFLSQNQQIFIISKKTLATLCSCQSKIMGKIERIILDKIGNKFIAIDSNRKAVVFKYDLSFQGISLIHKVNSEKIRDAIWTDYSTKILFTTSSKNLLEYDFIESKEVKHSLQDFGWSHCRIEKTPNETKALLINKKNCQLAYLDLESFTLGEILKMQDLDTIKCYVVSEDRKVLGIGSKNGLVKLINLENFDIFYSKIFTSQDKNKKLRIQDLAIMNNYVLCSFSNGCMSIIYKI